MLISPEAVLGLPGYQITGIEEVAGRIRISVRHAGPKPARTATAIGCESKTSAGDSRGTKVGGCGIACWN